MPRNRHISAQKRRRIDFRRAQPSFGTNSRRGSTLMIVMVLMGMLALLGVLFYTFAAQERSNAEYYSDAAKNRAEPSLTADALFDWALDQIIVGTDRRLTNSMLWGSRHSLLSNALGVGYHAPGDLHPFNGEGLNLIFDASGNIAVDQNRNGLPDDGSAGENDYRYLLDYNDSVAAPKQFDSGERQVFNGPKYFPQTDVGYTYPDINNTFLTYVGKVRDVGGGVHRVVKPAYLVPGLLRLPTAGTSAPLTYEDTNFNGILDPGEDLNGNGRLDDWCVNPTTSARIMRSHPSHLYVPSGGLPAVPVNRYLTDAEATSLIGPTAHGFPFHPMDPTYNTTTGVGAVYVKGRMGAFSKLDINPANDDPVEFDYDNDGDGFNESILMDLDFPPQQDASGKMFVPLFLITIHDLDALINLNAHGNLAKILLGPNDLAQANTPVSNTANPFGSTNVTPFPFNFISQSNLGLGPSEVNPLWVLNGRFGTDNSVGSTVFTQHRQFFGTSPSSLSAPNPVWGETANMEFAWTKIGRPDFSISGSGNLSDIQDLFPGVYGEEGLLYSAKQANTLASTGGQSLPRPGISLQDDNGDINEGQNFIPYFQHPLDYSGLGTYLATGNPKRLNWSTPAVGSNQYISYKSYGNNSNSIATSYVRWGQTAGLMNNSITQGLGDDPNEVSFYALRKDIDNVFTSEEMLYLNLNNTEIDRLNITSRLAKLVPFNFAKTLTDNSRGDSIRRKFTVDSNDRKSYGLPISLRAGQEYSFDTNSTTFKFPPQFGTVPRYSTIPLVEDPIRPSTRTLLEIERNSVQSKNRLQRKLSINRLLTGDANNFPSFRNLTPHPDDPGAGVVSAAAGVTVYPPTTVAGQEYWARNDRQKMARDIYVLLYLLGHGDDAMNTATTANATPSLLTDGSTLYSEPQLREMAQFAVNLVDSMDRDNVITRFEYDKDLSDGWNLDDNPYGTIEATPYTSANTNYISSYPNDSASRGEVFGIERLDLTISESLCIQAKQSPSSMNYTQTNYNESTSDRFFFFVELRNHSPFAVNFSATKDTWQIVLRQEASGVANPTWERRLILTDPTVTINNTTSPYVIGSTDASTASSAFSRSTFAVDPTWSGTPTVRVAPNKPAGTPVMDCDLDLIETPATTVFRIEDESGTNLSGTSGAMLSAFTGATPIANMTTPGSTLKVILRRRAHLTRTTASTADNPWVDVDTMMLQTGTGFQVFDMGAVPTAAIAAAKLPNVKSIERPQPLDGGTSESASTGTGVATTVNTLGVKNSLTTGSSDPFSLWQLHFDRDFASVMDLLYLPVFGPHQLTALAKAAFVDSADTQVQVVNQVSNSNWKTGPAPGVPYKIAAKSAASKFMAPEDPSNFGNPSPSRWLDNRWHRVLELLEVPTRSNVNLGAGTDMTIPRVPGRMNLNTIRHADNLAALLDDARLLGLNLPPGDPEAPSLDDLTGDAARGDWWRQFLTSRDLNDPYAFINAGVAVPLPGLPGSKPFRNLADVGYTNPGSGKHASIEDTILRSLPVDAGLPSKRRLFEVGNRTEHLGVTVADPAVDPYIRNRLLSKIAGSTTTRSNCFAIFISAKYFQAVEQNGAIRIGGPLNGKPTPEHRGFFVVDRSKLENGQTSQGPTYDFRAFVNYRKTLQTQ